MSTLLANFWGMIFLVRICTSNAHMDVLSLIKTPFCGEAPLVNPRVFTLRAVEPFQCMVNFSAMMPKVDSRDKRLGVFNRKS